RARLSSAAARCAGVDPGAGATGTRSALSQFDMPNEVRCGDLLKILWHDGLGMSLYAKRLERGRFLWPTTAGDVAPISAAQLAYMLDGIDWRNPQLTYRPQAAG
ncbi:transposase, partial [Roseomonas sp. ACRSG]|nr:transposase [Roseomonas sp. ACRSG]